MEKQRKHEETLKLIALFREHEMLWNVKSSSYRRKDLKYKALEEIAAECNSSVDAVQRRLKALRSTYVIETKKIQRSRKSAGEGGKVYEPCLHWYKEMSFLDSAIVIRKPVDNSSTAIREPIDSVKDLDSDETNIPFESVDNYDTTSDQSIESELSYTPSASKKKRCREDEGTLKIDETLDKLISLIKPNTDVYSAFAESMVMQLRLMPERVAYRTITDIQNLLYKRRFEDNEPNLNGRFYDAMSATRIKRDSDSL